MAISANLDRTIKDFFRNYTVVRKMNAIKSKGNKFELYVFSLVYKALSKNFRLRAKNMTGGSFNFKTSPGPVNSKYSHFEFDSNHHGLMELRNGIEYRGHLMAHEVDISIQEDSCGRDNYRPDRIELKLAVECKFYSNANALKGEARKNLGAITDLSLAKHSSAHIAHDVGCIHCGIGFAPVFAANVDSNNRLDIQHFLDSYGLHARFGLLPGSAHERNFIKYIVTITKDL